MCQYPIIMGSAFMGSAGYMSTRCVNIPYNYESSSKVSLIILRKRFILLHVKCDFLFHQTWNILIPPVIKASMALKNFLLIWTIFSSVYSSNTLTISKYLQEPIEPLTGTTSKTGASINSLMQASS